MRYGVLSLLVFFAIFILALENYKTWTLPVEALPEKGVVKKSAEKIESPPAVTGQKESTDVQSYIFVSDKNIFSPERKEFPIIAPPQQGKPPTVRPQITLYGVTIAGDYQSASIVNSGRPIKPGERQMMSVKVGDQIGEFKVAKILSDRITMEAAEDSFEVLLYDPRTPKQRTYAKTEVRPATVTTTLPTPAPGPTPVPAAVPTAVQPAAPVPVPTPPPVSTPRVTPGVPTGVTPAPSTPAMAPTQTVDQTQAPPSTTRFQRSRTPVVPGQP